MDGTTHRLFAASASLAYSTAAGIPGWQAAAAAVIATATSAGWTSPDADQSWLEWVPGGHRGLTHWWGLPALLAVATIVFVPPEAAWVLWALLLGWGSHLVGDFIFGERPPGIPMAPWWAYAGLGLNSGGLVERLLRWAFPAVLAYQVWIFAGGPAWSVLPSSLSAAPG
jgi:LexA-binding, inner membrane-associated putative hydrolase